MGHPPGGARHEKTNVEGLTSVGLVFPWLTPLQYPFGGLPNFPEAYPILLSGSAQSNTSVGQSVTGGWSEAALAVPYHCH